MSACDNAARSEASGDDDVFCSDDDDKCALCTEDFGEPGSKQEAKILPCGTHSRHHTFCLSCLEKWSSGEVGNTPYLSSSMPRCRMPCPSSSQPQFSISKACLPAPNRARARKA